MARELRLEITAEATQAKRALSEVESGIKKVEGAAKSTDQSITKLTKSVSDENEAWLKSVKSGEQMRKTLADVDVVKTKLTATTTGLSKTADGLIERYTGLTGATTTLTAATGLSIGALATLTVGLTAAAVASTAFAALIVKSTQHYFEHSKATKDSRDELKKLEQGWNAFQMAVGGAVLGDDFSIVRPIRLLNIALVATGGYIAYTIEQTKVWVEWLARASSSTGFAFLSRMLTNTSPAADVNLPAPYRARDPRTGMSQEQFYAEAQIDALQARLKQQAVAAKEAAKALAEHNAEIRKFWANVNPGVSLGITGSLPG